MGSVWDDDDGGSSGIPAPGSPVEEDLLLYRGGAWTRFARGADGSILGYDAAGLASQSAQDWNLVVAPTTPAEEDLLLYRGGVWVGQAKGSDGTLLGYASGQLGPLSASSVRSALSLVVGTDVQAYDAELSALAGLSSAADKAPYFTGTGTAALYTVTTFGRALVGYADAGSVRSALSLVPGVDVAVYGAAPTAHASSHAAGASDPISVWPFLLATYFGAGSDGALVFDGTSSVTIGGVSHAPSGGVYTLTRAVEAASITMSGCAIATAGFWIRCSGAFTTSGTCVVKDDGNAGSGASAGSALQNFTSTGGRTAPSGGNGGSGLANGSGGNNNSTTGAGGAGGAGGASVLRSGGAAGASTQATAAAWYGSWVTTMGVGLYNNSGTLSLRGLECGAGGGGGGSDAGGTGGGGGGGGGFVAVWAKSIVISSGTLTFRALGGNGAAGAVLAGGGGGGGGGLVQVFCHTCSGSPTLSAAGGSGGAHAGVGTSDGASGAAGHTRFCANGTQTET